MQSNPSLASVIALWRIYLNYDLQGKRREWKSKLKAHTVDNAAHGRRGLLTHRGGGAVFHLPDFIQHHVLDEDGDGLQDERYKQVYVDVVPGAVQLPSKTVTQVDIQS